MTENRSDWRELRVVRRIVESDTIVSLELAAADGAALPAFAAGQFLTFRIIGPDGKASPRSYSLSSDPAAGSRYRISVRREPGGLGSGQMQDAMPVDAILQASGPKGRFTLDKASAKPVLLLAGGIGITPLLAMAYALAAQPGRPTWLIQAGRNAGVLPFADEIRALTAGAANITAFTCLSDPEAAADEAQRVVKGRVTRAFLRSVLPLDDYVVYLCGPPAFMQAIFDILLSLGVSEQRIAYEFFGPFRKLSSSLADGEEGQPLPTRPVAGDDDDRALVTFTKSRIARRWDGAHRTLLDFAEAQGLTPAFSCRNGICNTCLSAVEGSVRYIEEPLEDPGPDRALLCCTVPVGRLRIDI